MPLTSIVPARGPDDVVYWEGTVGWNTGDKKHYSPSYLWITSLGLIVHDAEGEKWFLPGNEISWVSNNSYNNLVIVGDGREGEGPNGHSFSITVGPTYIDNQPPVTGLWWKIPRDLVGTLLTGDLGDPAKEVGPPADPNSLVGQVLAAIRKFPSVEP